MLAEPGEQSAGADHEKKDFTARQAHGSHFIPVYTRAHAREAADGKLVYARARPPTENCRCGQICCAGLTSDQCQSQCGFGAALAQDHECLAKSNPLMRLPVRSRTKRWRCRSDPTGLHTMRPKAIHGREVDTKRGT
jgi:hypothetical protein